MADASESDRHANKYGKLDDLAGIPTELSDDGFPKDVQGWLDSLPTTVVEDLSDIFTDYPASVGDSEGVSISTRIPASWLEQFDVIREMPGTNLPDIWSTRAKLLRWCVMQGLRAIKATADELNAEGRLSQPLDATLSARIFLEHKGGKIAARADAMNMARSQVEDIAQAVSSAIAMHEDAEGADMINEWISGARLQQSPFWQNYLVKLLVDHEQLRYAIRHFTENGLLVDEYTIELAAQHGVYDDPPQQGEG